jgi:twinkle protein
VNKKPAIKPASDFYDSVFERFYPRDTKRPGFAYGWDEPLRKDLRCLPGEMSIWTGINGHGKSLILGQVALMAKEAGEKVIIASFEMKAEKTLYRMIRQATAQRRPEGADIAAALDWMKDGISIYDFVGRADVATMQRMFMEAAQMGYTQFIVDSLMKLGLAEDDYNSQKRICEDLQNFSQDYNVHVHLVAHPRKGADEMSPMGKMDVMGAGGITNVADNVYSVWRNKKKEDRLTELERTKSTFIPTEIMNDCDAILWCCKHREDGSDVERKYALWYEKQSMQYLSRPDEGPKRWLEGNPGTGNTQRGNRYGDYP